MPKRLLSLDECELARQLWMAGEREQAVAEALSCTIDVFRQLRKTGQLRGLPDRKALTKLNRGYRSPEVTPEQIKEKCLAIQATWSDAVRAARAGLTSSTGPGFRLQTYSLHCSSSRRPGDIFDLPELGEDDDEGLDGLEFIEEEGD